MQLLPEHRIREFHEQLRENGCQTNFTPETTKLAYDLDRLYVIHEEDDHSPRRDVLKCFALDRNAVKRTFQVTLDQGLWPHPINHLPLLVAAAYLEDCHFGGHLEHMAHEHPSGNPQYRVIIYTD